MDLLDRLRADVPIGQAGMGGGLAGPELAVAVAAAGGLGTLGLAPPDRLRKSILRVCEGAPERAAAVNLLMPFVRRRHVDVCVESRIDVAVLGFGGDQALVERLRDAGVFVLAMVGSEDQARGIGEVASGSSNRLCPAAANPESADLLAHRPHRGNARRVGGPRSPVRRGVRSPDDQRDLGTASGQRVGRGLRRTVRVDGETGSMGNDDVVAEMSVKRSRHRDGSTRTAVRQPKRRPRLGLFRPDLAGR